MKKFDFKLQKLLEIRQDKEEQEKIELGKASGAYQFEVNKKVKILDRLSIFRKDLAKSKTHLDVSRLRDYDKLIRNSDLVINRLNVVIEEKREIMVEHIDKFAELKKERKVVETLKDKALKRYIEESDREEQKESDEIGKNLYLKHKDSRTNSEN